MQSHHRIILNAAAAAVALSLLSPLSALAQV